MTEVKNVTASSHGPSEITFCIILFVLFCFLSCWFGAIFSYVPNTVIRAPPTLPTPPPPQENLHGILRPVLLGPGKETSSFPQLRLSLPHLTAVLVGHDGKMRCVAYLKGAKNDFSS